MIRITAGKRIIWAFPKFFIPLGNYKILNTEKTMNENTKPGIEIQLDEQVAQGNYCNLAIIAHSTSEFVLDFATMLPGLPKARVKSRVVLTPEHAKRLLLSLQENITRYENNVGKINIPTKHIVDPFGHKGNA
jgi:hypothetical protein